ncbi:MAG: hypothetical protein ACJAZ3_000886 [Sphingobacteriales bacterium]|jgi:hypothetical protein
MRRFILIFLLLATTNFAFSQALNGTYAIGTGGNYPTINQAVLALVTSGVSGPVVFEIETSLQPYNERVSIPEITGASELNTITFTSKSGIADDVVVVGTTAAPDDHHIWQLNGADFIILDKITIQNLTKTFGTVVHLINAADNNIIRNCIIRSDSTSETAANFDLTTGGDEVNTFIGGVIATGPVSALDYVMYKQGNNCNNLLAENNTIIGGTMGIMLWGYGPKIKNNTVLNNNIIATTRHGMWFDSNDSLTISGNTVSMHRIGHPLSRSVSIAQVNDLTFSSNRISNIVYMGVFVEYSTGILFNNMIHSSLTRNFTDEASSHVDLHGMYLKNGGLKVYHNTVDIQDLTGVQTIDNDAIYSENSSGFHDIRNNIFVNKHEGFAIITDNKNIEGKGQVTLNHNVYYSNGTYIGNYGGSNAANLGDWKVETGMDDNSLEVNVMFTSEFDQHTVDPLIDFSGEFIAEIPYDIDGEIRNKKNPDAGADEFILHPIDLGLEFLLPPFGILGEEFTPIIGLANHGIADLSGSTAKIRLSLDGGLSYPFVDSLSLNQLVATSDTQSFFYGLATHIANEQGVNWVSAFVESAISGDDNPVNDTIVASYCIALGEKTYSIGASSDFSSIGEAVNFLNNSCAIAGNIVFEIDPGVYSDLLNFEQYYFSGDDFKVTFRGKTEDFKDVVVNTSGKGKHYSVNLFGSQNIAFENITFTAPSGLPNSCGVYLTKNAEHISFLNCSFNSDAKVEAETTYGILSAFDYNTSIFAVNSSGNIDITSCNFSDLTNGIRFNGDSKLSSSSIYISKNNFKTITDFGIRIKLANVNEISQNVFNNMDAEAISIDLESIVSDFNVSRNHINSGLIGINFESCTGISGATFSNNMIGNLSQQDGIGINGANSDRINIFNNTLHVSEEAYAAMQLAGVFELKILNNIMIHHGTRFSMYVSGAINLRGIDNNVYYSKGNVMAYWDENIASLYLLAEANGGDKNSIEFLPIFELDEVHTFDIELDGKGQPIPEVIIDFDGALRDALYPDIGADEFTSGIDISIEITSPISLEGTTDLRIEANIYNLGSEIVESFSIVGKINNVEVFNETVADANISTSGFYSFTSSMTHQFSNSTSDLCVEVILIEDVKPDNNANCVNYAASSISSNNDFSPIVYPNPFNEQLTISSESLIKGVKIFDAVGRQVYFGQHLGSTPTISTTNLNSGFYLMQVQLENLTTYNLRILK